MKSPFPECRIPCRVLRRDTDRHLVASLVPIDARCISPLILVAILATLFGGVVGFFTCAVQDARTVDRARDVLAIIGSDDPLPLPR